MAQLVALAAGVAGIAVGFAAGFFFGRRLSPSAPWLYWAANVAVFAAGVAIDVEGLLSGNLPVAVFGAGLVAGGISGLKYGFGRVRGIGERPSDGTDAAGEIGGHRAYPRDEPGSLTSPLGKGKADEIHVTRAPGPPEPPRHVPPFDKSFDD